jgi:hypothetical protein
MAAAQHGTNIVRHRQKHKGQKGRANNTTVSKSVHDWVFECKNGDKTVNCLCFLHLVPVAI